ncbi:DUF333 domain-containing protein [Candidatus Beckwithbacteria bacterium]|nr:DUF333 domain-containing protein [Candidatus Beckwithbacteria bacterium]
MKKILLFSFSLVLLLTACGFQNQSQNQSVNSLPTTTPVAKEETNQNVGIANPASANCETKGGKLEIKADNSGGQYGVCIWPDGKQCEEWALFRQECPEGGIDISKLQTQGEINCIIKGGKIDPEREVCTLPNETDYLIEGDNVICPML